jgi:hypothetical protein
VHFLATHSVMLLATRFLLVWSCGCSNGHAQTVAWGKAEAPVIEDVRLVRPSLLRAKFGVKLSECVANALATFSHLLLPDSECPTDQRPTPP